jgi:hypothetical protein
MVGASQLLMSSLGTSTRENQRSDALADAQRAVNIMSRELGNSGYGLVNNGIAAADCHPSSATDASPTQIRFRANLNAANNTTTDADEDVTYVYKGAPTFAIVRYDKKTNTKTVLASRIDAMKIYYINAAGVETSLATAGSVANAVRIKISVLVTLPPTGGQPASQVQLTSDVALRNASDVLGRY